MRKLNANPALYSCLLFIFFAFCGINSTTAQQTRMKDYVLFGGKNNLATGAVTLSSSTNVSGGSVGSYNLVSTTGSSTIGANIFSGGTVALANGNTVTGRISVANVASVSGNALAVGSNAALADNLDVLGNSSVVSGTVSGSVTHPAGTTYSGPLPAGGDNIGSPALPTLPSMPAILSFQPAVVGAIISSADINPGVYGDISLSGNKTLKFKGPGTFVFNKIANSGGGANEFIFDFQNTPGTFRIYIHKDADLGKIKVSTINGGDATKIYTEIHGDGSTISGGYCFNIANGSSSSAATRWLGTVWAPYAAINVGSGTGNSNIVGALWSSVAVYIHSGVNVSYAPYSDCTAPNVNAGTDVPLSFSNETPLTASSSTAGVTYSWQALNGGLISSPSDRASIIVAAAGTYVVTASINADCSATDTVLVAAKIRSLIGAELQSIYDNYSPTAPPSPFFLLQHDSIYIDVITLQNQYAATLSLLTSPTYGLTNILSNGSSNFIITGLYPIAKLPLLNALTAYIVYVRPYYAAISKSGIVTTAGDIAMRSNLVRQGYALSGEGVKVGVISNSYNTITSGGSNPTTNTAAQDVANGDLPGIGNPEGNLLPVHVLREYPFVGTDEGRGMLQIVHDVAPKAELYFRTGTISAGDFANGVIELKNAGCNIIVDDVTFITEPFLKDGVIAAAVDNVAASGTTYFSAAGNFADKSYENVYQSVAAPAGLAATAHNFGGGDRFQNITLSPGNYTIVLQWLDDIYSLGQTATGGTKNDLDIYLTPNTDGTALFGFNRVNTNGDPLEILPFSVTSTVNTNVLITNNTAGSNPARFKYVIFRGDVVFNEYSSGNSTIVGQANALGAIAVGAARYDKAAPYPGPLVAESFSSVGGTFIGGMVRNKPELVSVDGVNTTVNLGPIYPSSPGNGYSNFFGTSAAAPHAAAVAALIMEGKKKYSGILQMTPAQVRTVMQSAATDMYTPGFDFKSGYGFVNADASMRTFAQPKPTLTALQVPAGVTAGAVQFTLTLAGENFSSTSVVYFRDSALASTVFVNSNTLTALLPTFIGNPPLKVYTPPVSSSGLDGGTSNILRLLSAPKKLVKVIALNQEKKYGQQLPPLTFVVLVDGDSIQHTTLTLADLGLAQVVPTTTVTAASNTGSYLISISRIFNPANATDAGLLELYDYQFVNGSFLVTKLPVTVTAQDITINYNQKIPNTQFSYQFDATGIPDPTALLNSLTTLHSNQIARDQGGNDILGLVNGQAVTIVNGQAIPIVNGQAVTIVNGQALTIVNGQAIPIVNAQALTIVNGQAIPIVNNLTPTDISGLSFLATSPSVTGARVIDNKTLVNGVYQASSTQVVDITQESILKYDINSAQTSMLTSVSAVNARGLVDVNSYTNGQAVTIVNGQALTIVNGQALTIVNGQAVTIVNGQAVTIVNGQAIPIVNAQGKTAVILTDSEIGQGLSNLKALNLITGLGVGTQYIIPGSFINNNLALTYVAGVVHVNPALITITPAAGQNKIYGSSDPAFIYTNNAALPATAFSGNLARTAGEAPGNYTFNLGTLSAGANYTLQLGGSTQFSILPRQVTITPGAGQSKVYGDADPVFSFSNNGGLPSSAFTGRLGRQAGNNVGNYTFTLGNLSAGPNYTLSLATTTAVFAITKAALVVKAIDNYIYEKEQLPVFTFQVNSFKAGDVNPGVTYTLSPNYSGNAGVYTIIPVLNPFANSGNYNISYINGTFYVNPSGKNSKKLRAYLDCVREIPNPPPGSFRYIAHFYCINDNSSALYIPVGPDNKITSTGLFDNSQQAFIFTPGNTYFDVPFDGNTLSWQLTSYESTHKSSTSTNASSGSNKCNLTTPTVVKVLEAGKEEKVIPNEIKVVVNEKKAGTELKVVNITPLVTVAKVSIAPNPVNDRAIVMVSNALIDLKDIHLFDVSGRQAAAKIIGKRGPNAIELDVSALTSGIYFLKLKLNGTIKTFGMVKQ
ncbi:MAG: MBG domain-containing protein [Ferruginibacter sp.]